MDQAASIAARRTLHVERLGRRAYETALATQTARRDAVLAGADDHLLLVEHWPVITLGRGGDARHILRASAPVVRVNRGGDVTYHGPGQLVGYPIFDLAKHRKDLHWFLRQIEEALIVALARFGIAGERRSSYTGVWTGGRKIASIGIHVRQCVTWHGFALNVTTDLAGFAVINPCGEDPGVMTSMADVLAAPVAMAGVRDRVAARFAQALECTVVPATDA